MEGLLVLLLIIWLFHSAARKKQNEKSKQAKTQDALKNAAPKTSDVSQKEKEPSLLRQRAAEVSVQTKMFSEGQSHMQITGDIHGHPSVRAEYMGSMAADTSEGEDACDPSLGHERSASRKAVGVYPGEIGLESVVDISARGIVQGMVMGEILHRPQRRIAVRREGGHEEE